MRIVPDKSFMYPVLRPDSDDYVKGSFHANIQLQNQASTQTVRMESGMVLEQDELESMIQAGTAAFVLNIKCGDTYYRECLRSHKPSFRHDFQPGQLQGIVETVPFVVCIQDGQALTSRDFHSEFGADPFSVHAGHVLAYGTPCIYSVDSRFQGIGTIFEFVASPDVPEGTFRYVLEGSLILLHLSLRDADRFAQARKNNIEAQRAFMAGIYLPVVLSILTELDQTPQAYAGQKWHDVFQTVMARKDIRPPGQGEPGGRLEDAQKLLGNPFGWLPGMND